MNEQRALLRHFLAALAYRAQKALRGAPAEFADFRAPNLVRTPRQLVRHMDGVLSYARSSFVDGPYQPPLLASFDETVAHFHGVLEDLAHHLEAGTQFGRITPECILQGPFSDAMTHVGQLAMLRRLAGCPIPPEDFSRAAISGDNLGPDQPASVSPDEEWPERL